MKIQLTEKGLVTFSALCVCGTLLIMGRDNIIAYSLLGVIVGYYGIEVWPTITRITKRKGE